MNQEDLTLLKSLKDFSRFTPGHMRLNGLSIRFNDSLSLYHEYTDIFIRRIYEFKPAHPFPVILDAGGYIGLSALFFKTLCPKAKITVFEPDPLTGALLKENLLENRFLDVDLIAAGIGKREGKRLYFPDGADGGNSLVPAEKGSIEVDIVRLSDYIRGPVDLLKMNIEGMEGEVFEEIEPKLSMVREIIFEYHAFHDLPQNLGKILNILDRNGFRYLVADVPCIKTALPFRMKKNYRQYNLVYATRGNL